MRVWMVAVGLGWVLGAGLGLGQGQTASPAAGAAGAAAGQDQTQTLEARTTLVLVPALVTTKKGEPVFTLTADDFVLTDDGVPQKLRLEEESGDQPLALVVLVQAGGDGTPKVDENLYGKVGPMVEAMIGNVEHTVAVVGFDSQAALVQPFTSDIVVARQAIAGIGPGDGGAAILDGLKFSVDLLAKQPPRYRRAVLMFTETHDHGSHVKVVDAVRDVSDTNTTVYSFAFSSTRAESKKEASGFSSSEAGPEHGCFARDPNADKTKQPTVISQDYDCLAMLAPPLRAARIALMAVIGSLEKNVPETVAKLTGGEYYSFSNVSNLQKGLEELTNHIPNRYLLTFTPLNPHPGLHSLTLQLKDRPELKVDARGSYWAGGGTPAITAP
jgi:VWFA-related protein